MDRGRSQLVLWLVCAVAASALGAEFPQCSELPVCSGVFPVDVVSGGRYVLSDCCVMRDRLFVLGDVRNASILLQRVVTAPTLLTASSLVWTKSNTALNNVVLLNVNVTIVGCSLFATNAVVALDSAQRIAQLLMVFKDSSVRCDTKPMCLASLIGFEVSEVVVVVESCSVHGNVASAVLLAGRDTVTDTSITIRSSVMNISAEWVVRVGGYNTWNPIVRGSILQLHGNVLHLFEDSISAFKYVLTSALHNVVVNVSNSSLLLMGTVGADIVDVSGSIISNLSIQLIGLGATMRCDGGDSRTAFPVHVKGVTSDATIAVRRSRFTVFLKTGHDVDAAVAGQSSVGAAIVNHPTSLTRACVDATDVTVNVTFGGGYLSSPSGGVPVGTFQTSMVVIGLDMGSAVNVSVSVARCVLLHRYVPWLPPGGVVNRVIAEFAYLVLCNALDVRNVTVDVADSCVLRSSNLTKVYKFMGLPRAFALVGCMNAFQYVSTASSLPPSDGPVVVANGFSASVRNCTFALAIDADQDDASNDISFVALDGVHERLRVSVLSCTTAALRKTDLVEAASLSLLTTMLPAAIGDTVVGDEAATFVAWSAVLLASRNMKFSNETRVEVVGSATFAQVFAPVYQRPLTHVTFQPLLTSLQMQGTTLVVVFCALVPPLSSALVSQVTSSVPKGKLSEASSLWFLNGNRVQAGTEPSLAKLSVNQTVVGETNAHPIRVVMRCNAWDLATRNITSAATAPRLLTRLATGDTSDRVTAHHAQKCCVQPERRGEDFSCPVPLKPTSFSVDSSLVFDVQLGYYHRETRTLPVRAVDPPPERVSPFVSAAASTALIAALAVSSVAGASNPTFLQVSVLSGRLTAIDGNCEFAIGRLDSPTLLSLCLEGKLEEDEASSSNAAGDTRCLSAGAVVGNMCVCLACGFVLWLISLAVSLRKRSKSQKKPPADVTRITVEDFQLGIGTQKLTTAALAVDALLDAALPGALVIPLSLLLQPTVASLLYLLLSGTPAFGEFLYCAVAAVLLLAAIILFTVRSVWRVPCTCVVASSRVPLRSGSIAQRCLAALHWFVDERWAWTARCAGVPPVVSRQYLQMYGALFDAYRPARTWFLVVDFTVALLCGVVAGAAHVIGCANSVYVLLGLGVTALVLVVFTRPFTAVSGNVFYFAVASLTVLVALLAAAGDEAAGASVALAQSVLVALQVMGGWFTVSIRRMHRGGRKSAVLLLAWSALDGTAQRSSPSTLENSLPDSNIAIEKQSEALKMLIELVTTGTRTILDENNRNAVVA